MKHRLLTLALVLLPLLAACGDSDSESTHNGTNNGATNNGATNNGTTNNGATNNGATNNGDYPTIQRENGWIEVVPGGETTCSRGAPFAFFVNPGTENKLVVDFIGGGACWNDLTCSIAGSIFSETVDGVRDAASDVAGIYDRQNPDNPFRTWTHVIIPYCTGDIHWGNSVQTYREPGSEFQINHKGAVNARAVLAWTWERYASPDNVLVTGCSAGSYGSIGWAPYVMRQYPDTRVVQFGDSGAGVITDTFFEDSFPRWNAQEIFPDWISALDLTVVDYKTLALPDLYSGVGNFYPNHIVSQYNTILDENQTFYFQAMGGGTAQEWSDQMVASIAETHTATPNFHSFTAPGEMHCILPYNEFYSVQSDGVKLTDWLEALIDGQPLPDVDCAECSN